MEEESRRPHRHADQLGEAELCAIVSLQVAHPRWGPRKIRERYLRQHGKVASESSFKRVLERAGLTEKRKRRRAVMEGGD
jgi:putative transposase